jgi:hypothetical protein
MALALDSNASSRDSATATGSNTIVSSAIGTNLAFDLVIAVVAVERAASSHATLSGIARTSGSGKLGAFTKRSSLYQDNVTNNTGGASWNSLEVWSAATGSGTLTANVLTATLSGGVLGDNAVMLIVSVNWDGVTAPRWTSNAPCPATATDKSVGATTPNVSGVSTDQANMVFGFAMNGDFVVQPPAPATRSRSRRETAAARWAAPGRSSTNRTPRPSAASAWPSARPCRRGP